MYQLRLYLFTMEHCQQNSGLLAVNHSGGSLQKMSEKFAVERLEVDSGHVVHGSDNLIMQQGMRPLHQHLHAHAYSCSRA